LAGVHLFDGLCMCGFVILGLDPRRHGFRIKSAMTASRGGVRGSFKRVVKEGG